MSKRYCKYYVLQGADQRLSRHFNDACECDGYGDAIRTRDYYKQYTEDPVVAYKAYFWKRDKTLESYEEL